MRSHHDSPEPVTNDRKMVLKRVLMKGRNPKSRGSRISAVCCTSECILTIVGKNARCISSNNQHHKTFFDMNVLFILFDDDQGSNYVTEELPHAQLPAMVAFSKCRYYLDNCADH
jgi:hypothetical protein